MSSQERKKSNKRKSMASSQGAASTGPKGDVSVIVAEPSAYAGPVFANFPSVRPNKATPFTVYSREADPSKSDVAAQNTLLAGETDDVEFYSLNRDRDPDEASGCQYVPALYDPATKTLQVHPSAPLYLLGHRVKRMRHDNTSAALPSEAAATMWKTKRNDLGEAFGTRKAKSQIKADARNKVDVTAMEGVKADLMASIGGKANVDEGPVPPPELIPTPNLETSNPAEVYPRSSLLSDSEWLAIKVNGLVEGDDRTRAALLPYRKSRWVEDKLRHAIHSPSTTRKNNLRMLFYLSCMLALYSFAGGLSKTPAAEIPNKFPQVPSQVLQGLLSRFAEKDGKRFIVSDKSKTKLLAHICTGYLACDGWSADIAKVASDLSMTPTKVMDIYKSLGCSVDLPTAAEREKRGVSASEASKLRRATLKAPVKYPKPKRRGPVKR